MNKLIHVTVCDSNTLARNGITALLKSYNNFTVSHNDNDKDFLATVNSQGFYSDVCILDGDYSITGYHTFQTLKKTRPEMKTLILSMFNNELNILRYLKAGANGYLLKSSAPQTFHDAINTIYNNGHYYPEEILCKLSSLQNSHIKNAGISQYEYQFMTLCGTELTYKEIANKMHLSLRTIDGYREHLFKKLNVKSRVGLVMYAIKSGIIITDNI